MRYHAPAHEDDDGEVSEAGEEGGAGGAGPVSEMPSLH